MAHAAAARIAAPQWSKEDMFVVLAATPQTCFSTNFLEELHMTSLDLLFVSPQGRVEGDLDVRSPSTTVSSRRAWTEAAMFRGFEIILRAGPAGRSRSSPRICGICGGIHLKVRLRPGHRLAHPHAGERHPDAQHRRACETLQSIPRYFALFAIDLTNKNYAKSKMYDEAVRRFAPYVGTSYQKGVVLSNKPVEVYAIFGGSGRTRASWCPVV